MEITKEEASLAEDILKQYTTTPSRVMLQDYRADTVLEAMVEYSIVNTTKLYTYSEVIEIAEKVKAECINNSFVIYNQPVNKLCPEAIVDRVRIKIIDVNQFIPKK